MGTALFCIIIYIAWLRTFIETARIGKSLFLPDFKAIAAAYSYGGYNWNTWHGKSFYYIGLMINLITALLVLLLIASIIVSIFRLDR